jgi:hypothetical protein
MRENRTSGSVCGAPGNGRSYHRYPMREEKHSYSQMKRQLSSIPKRIGGHLTGEIVAIIVFALALSIVFLKQIYVWLPLSVILLVSPGVAYLHKSFKNKSFVQLFIGIGLLSIFAFAVFLKIKKT